MKDKKEKKKERGTKNEQIKTIRSGTSGSKETNHSIRVKTCIQFAFKELEPKKSLVPQRWNPELDPKQKFAATVTELKLRQSLQSQS